MSDMLVMDRIESNFSRLKLSRISEIISSLARTAEEERKRQSDFSWPSGSRQNTSCRIPCSQSLSDRHEYVFYQYGESDPETEKRL